VIIVAEGIGMRDASSLIRIISRKGDSEKIEEAAGIAGTGPVPKEPTLRSAGRASNFPAGLGGCYMVVLQGRCLQLDERPSPKDANWTRA